MTRTITTLLVLLAAATYIKAQKLHNKFEVMRDICVKARTAYLKKDADALALNTLALDSLRHDALTPLSTWKGLVPDYTVDRSRYSGHLLFEVEWMDSIVANWIGSKQLIDKSTPLRGNGLMAVNFLIPANSRKRFTANGRGLMTVMVIAEEEAEIEVMIDQESCGKHSVLKPKETKGCVIDVWQAQSKPQPMTPYTIEVKNPLNKDLVCVFVTD